MATDSEVRAFQQKILKGCQNTQIKYGVFTSVSIAQACLESSNGTSSLAKTDNNLFGIKYAGNHSPDISITQGSWATDDGGYYAKYKSWDDSIIDHGYFLKYNPRYTEHGVFNAKNGYEQAKAIAESGYATDKNYYSKLKSEIDYYNLTQYDNIDSNQNQKIIDKAVKWAIDIAKDDTHGYDQSNRWGLDYDCSSFVISAYTQAGLDLKGNGATYTGNMKEVCLKLGFEEVPITDWGNGSQFKKGDIILNEVHHVCLAIGNGQIVQASINENGGTTGGQSGDQTGKEIYIRDYYVYSSGWNCCLRLKTNGGSTGGGASGGDSGEFKKGDKVTFSSNTIHGKKYGIDKYGKRVRKRYETYFFLKESGKYYILYSGEENNYIKVIKKYVKKV